MVDFIVLLGSRPNEGGGRVERLLAYAARIKRQFTVPGTKEAEVGEGDLGGHSVYDAVV